MAGNAGFIPLGEGRMAKFQYHEGIHPLGTGPEV